MNERIRSIVDRPWKIVLLKSGDRHIFPLFDYREHTTEGLCHCVPRTDCCLGGLVMLTIHRSMDGREILEHALAAAWCEKS